MNADERLAILENEVNHNQQDIHELFAFIREHMKKEEQDRQIMLDLMQQLKSRGDRQAYFISGIVFSVSLAWTVIKVL